MAGLHRLLMRPLCSCPSARHHSATAKSACRTLARCCDLDETPGSSFPCGAWECAAQLRPRACPRSGHGSRCAGPDARRSSPAGRSGQPSDLHLHQGGNADHLAQQIGIRGILHSARRFIISSVISDSSNQSGVSNPPYRRNAGDYRKTVHPLRRN